MKDGLWAVVPAYNEARVVAETLRGLLAVVPRVVVVDDASTDDTAREVSALPVTLLHHPLNLGQGAALATGIAFALAQGARYVVTFDADGQHLPEDVPALLAPLESGAYDVALGSRFLGRPPENLPPVRRLVLKAAVRYNSLTTGLRLTDAHNGLRAFTRHAAAAIRIHQNRMAHASEIVEEIRRHRLRHVEVPVTIRYTEHSLAKGQRLSNALNILWELSQGRIRE